MANNEPHVINSSKEYNGQNGFHGDSEKRMNAWNREERPDSERLADFAAIKEEKETEAVFLNCADGRSAICVHKQCPVRALCG